MRSSGVRTFARARGPSFALVGMLLASSCGEGETVTLGRAAGTLELVGALDSTADEENPTLTRDLLEIYFISDREDGSGDHDIWFARRSSVDEPFGEPEELSAINTADFESSPALSADGLTLWFGSDREGGQGGVDIWVTHRESRDDEWGEPENVSELNSDSDEIPRPLGDGETTMPLASRRGADGLYKTYLARRSAPDEPFSAPELVESLVEGESVVVDAWLSDDGRELWYKRTEGGAPGDIYVARRDGSGNFVGAEPATLVNSDAEERDPWVSADGRRIFFASDRGGDLAIYELSVP